VRPDATAAAGDLWRAWRAFAEDNGEAAGAQRAFAAALLARGFERDRRETARFYRGIGLTPDAS
jgi:phage/plasmid-associated DNA primase